MRPTPHSRRALLPRAGVVPAHALFGSALHGVRARRTLQRLGLLGLAVFVLCGFVPPVAARAPLALSGVQDGATLAGRVRIEAHPTSRVTYVSFALTGPKAYQHTEYGAPYTLAPASQGAVFDSTAYPDGAYTLRVLAATNGNAVAETTLRLVIANAPAPTTLTITGVRAGATISGSVDIRAVPAGPVAYVTFALRGPRIHEQREYGAPYTLFGANGSDAQLWDTTTFPDGAYTLTVEAVAGPQRQTATLRFTVANTAAPVPQGRLRWAPPALINPITIALKDGYTHVRLDPQQDYILKLPPYPKRGGTHITGGRNVVLIGGHVQLPARQQADDGQIIACDVQKNCGDGACSTRADPPTSWSYHKYCRAFYIEQSTGTVHIEGVLIDGTRTKQDAFAISAPAAIVQIQNVRVEGLYGDEATWHADVIQPWGGVKELRVDRLTAETAFQGLQIAPDPRGNPTIGPIRVSRTNITGRGNWKMMASYGCRFAQQLEFNEVYVQPGPGRTLATTVWPPATGDQACKAVVRNGTEAFWPAAPMQGVVKRGPPPAGDFVRAGVAGTAYRSPGYNE